MDDNAAQFVAQLVGSGFFDLEMTDEGILIYQLSDDAEHIAPELYKQMKEAMTQELLEFAHMGLIETRFNDELDLEWRWTPLGIEYLRKSGQIPPE